MLSAASRRGTLTPSPQPSVKLGAFMRTHPEVTEIDINPLMVFGQEEGVLALDALIFCHG